MSKPMRTNNPSEWTALDGVYIDEIKPPGKITGSGSAVVAIIGQFQMGPYEATTIESSGYLISVFGQGDYGGYKALMSKSFSNLIVKRVKGGDTAKTAFATLNDAQTTPTPSVKCEALYDGLYGNQIKVKSLVATSGEATKFDVLVTYGSKTEMFLNLALTDLPVTGTICKLSKADGATAIPAVNQEVTLTQGSDGTVTSADYITALSELEAYEGITLIFTDSPADDVNLGLVTHCNSMGDIVPIFHFPKGTTKAEAITKVTALRSALDRGIAAFPWLYQYNQLTDATELTNPAAWAASLISQIAEEWDPAVAEATKYLTGVKGLEFDLNRTDYIQLKNAGIMAYEFDKDLGYKIKSGVTVSTDQTLSMIFRRRMADLITSDVGTGLKPYQNKIMTDDNKTDVLGAVTKYLQDKKDNNRIKAYTVDGVSMNTTTSEANGEYHILILVQLFASMRYIVLHAQIGETVTITEGSAS